MKKFLAAPLAATAVALSLVGCAQAPGSSSSTSSATSETTSTTTSSTGSGSGSGGASNGNFKACMVSDLGGFDDKSFNQTSHDGLMKAKQDLGIETGQMQSASDSVYAQNIASMVNAKCNLIIGVGFKLSEAAVASAKQNPNVDYAIVDDNPAGAKGLKNFKPLVFNTAQSAFEAGYLAAAMSKTGKVATFGGMKIPTVTIFMDGYAQGVEYYNKQKNKNVQVLGWDTAKQDGQFLPSAGGNPFANVAGGVTIATNLMNQGADIIMPVAGGSGVGALQVAQKSGGKVNAIWVDTDGYVSNAAYKSVILTSVQKGLDVAVYNAIKAAKDGSWSSDPYVGTLTNQGTGIAPFHDFDSKVPSDVKSDLAQITKDIESGKIAITSAAQPK